MPESRNIPGALKIVAVIFLLGGLGGAWGIIAKLFAGNISFDLGVLGIPTYFGLRRFSRGWRTWALICIWFGLIFCPIIFIMGFSISRPATFTFFGIPAGYVSPVWLSISSVPFFFLDLWQYRVLTRPDIRALFFHVR